MEHNSCERMLDMVMRYGEICSQRTAAEILSVNPRTIYVMIKNKRLKRIGRYVDVRSIAEYIIGERSKSKPEEATSPWPTPKKYTTRNVSRLDTMLELHGELCTLDETAKIISGSRGRVSKLYAERLLRKYSVSLVETRSIYDYIEALAKDRLPALAKANASTGSDEKRLKECAAGMLQRYGDHCSLKAAAEILNIRDFGKVRSLIKTKNIEADDFGILTVSLANYIGNRITEYNELKPHKNNCSVYTQLIMNARILCQVCSGCSAECPLIKKMIEMHS